MMGRGEGHNKTDEVQQELRELMLFVARPPSETRTGRRECCSQAENETRRAQSDVVAPEGKEQPSVVAVRERLERRRARQLLKPMSTVIMASGTLRMSIAMPKIDAQTLLTRADLGKRFRHWAAKGRNA